MTAHPLADNYRAERAELVALGRSLSDDQAATRTTACPAWSIKDVYAHLAGISTNIVEGNTEGAATEAWADGHVADRRDRSLTEILDEWETAGQTVSATMDEAGEFFPFQLFVDQWTHGWDIRSALGSDASAVPDTTVYEHFLDEFFENMSGRTPASLPAVTLKVAGRSFDLGTESAIGELELDLFEYGRVSMGRRSQQQLDALPWPEAVTDRAHYIDLLVVWSVSDHDVIDPVAS